MQYLRQSGEKCHVYELIDRRPKHCHYPHIEYGDIVYDKNGYRATNAYVYTGDFERLSDMGPGNGSGGISRCISKHIENPITFYDMDSIYTGDVAEIELDTKAHMLLLREEAGNRDVSDKFEFICDYYNGMPEITFKSAKLYDGTSRDLTLMADLYDCYLTGDDFTDVDPITLEEKSEKMENYVKNVSKVFQINNRVHYQLKSKNSQSVGLVVIVDVKYDDKNNPIEAVAEDKYKLGVHGVKQTLFKFIPVGGDNGDVPVWTCLELDMPKKCELTLCEYNFSKHYYDYGALDN